MELEYRITHSYIDKFSRPFERNQIRLERFNKQVEKSISLFDSLKLDKSFKLSFDSRSFSQEIDTVKKELKKIETFKFEGEQNLSIPTSNELKSFINWENKFSLPKLYEVESTVNWRNKTKPPEIQETESFINWKNRFKEPTIPKLNSSINWENKFLSPDIKTLEVPLNWKNELTIPKLQRLESSVRWKNRFRLPEIPELTGSIEWQNNFKQPTLETLKPEIEYEEAFRTSKKFSTKLDKLLKTALHVEPDLRTRRLFRNTKLTLRKLNREFERCEPAITLRIDESAIQKQLEEIKREISTQSFVSSISVGFGLSQLKDQLKEEGLSLSEALYESTKYGLKKSKLAYEIAQEVNKTGGYIDATDIGNNIVTALRQGVRGSEKELAYFGTVMAKFQKAFDVSAEEMGGIIYSLQRFHIPIEEFDKVLGKAVALRKEFNITSDTMKEIMKDIDQNFGFVMFRLDKKARAKFIVRMEEFASALENSYVDSTKFMQMLSGALSGNAEDLQKAYYLTGLNFEQLRKLIESGNIQKIGESFLKQAQNLYKQYGKLAPTQQAIIAKNLGIDPKEFQQILQIGKNTESFRETLQKAFTIRAESPDKVIQESTNLTRYMNIIKNKIIGYFSNLGEGFIDAISGIFDLVSSPLGAVATAWIGQKFGRKILKWMSGKLFGFFSKRMLSNFTKESIGEIGKLTISRLASLGSQAGKGLLSGIFGEIRSRGLSFLSKGLSFISKLSVLLSIASMVLEPEEVNVNEEELLAQWEKKHKNLSPELKVEPKYSLDEILKKQIQVESSGNQFAVSKAGAVGLAQFMPKTWEDLWSHRRKLFEKYNPEIAQFKGIPDIYDPKAQLAAQKAYMSYLLDRFKDVRWALAAYNAGEGKIQKLYSQFGGDFTKAFSFLPQETQNYVKKILSKSEVRPVVAIPESKTITESVKEPQLQTSFSPERMQKQQKEESPEIAILKEISNSLLAIQQLIAQAYQRKLLIPEGVTLPQVDPFELWRKN